MTKRVPSAGNSDDRVWSFSFKVARLTMFLLPGLVISYANHVPDLSVDRRLTGLV